MTSNVAFLKLRLLFANEFKEIELEVDENLGVAPVNKLLVLEDEKN